MKGFRLDKSFGGALYAALITAGASLPAIFADGTPSKAELWMLAVTAIGAFVGWLKTHPPAFVTEEAVTASQEVADKAQGVANEIAAQVPKP